MSVRVLVVILMASVAALASQKVIPTGDGRTFLMVDGDNPGVTIIVQIPTKADWARQYSLDTTVAVRDTTRGRPDTVGTARRDTTRVDTTGAARKARKVMR